MAAFLLESLVLRGCVRQDVPALGLGAVAFGTPNPRNTTPFITPMPGARTPPQGEEPDADTASGTLPGAGRSRRLSGIRVHGIASKRWPYPTSSVAVRRTAN
jgi:hypothetical protein